MRRPLIDRDPGDEQASLFPPESTMPTRCTCGCTRKNLCPIDASIAHGGADKWAKRPRTCLSRHDPAEGEIPF